MNSTQNWAPGVDPVRVAHDAELTAGHPSEAHLLDADEPWMRLAPGWTEARVAVAERAAERITARLAAQVGGAA